MKPIDTFSYELGAADCFCEMVRAGVKRLALAHPCDSPRSGTSTCPISRSCAGSTASSSTWRTRPF